MLRIVLDQHDFHALVRGESIVKDDDAPVSTSEEAEIILADIGFAVMRQEIDEAENTREAWLTRKYTP